MPSPLTRLRIRRSRFERGDKWLPLPRTTPGRWLTRWRRRSLYLARHEKAEPKHK